MVKRRLLREQSGQAVVEYILLLLVVVGAFLQISAWLKRGKFQENLAKGLKDDYARVYRYGDPLAKGYPDDAPYNDGGPYRHPRIVTPDNQNFRIFINPGEN